jgi:multiple sugar transport system ATP-binding protein
MVQVSSPLELYDRPKTQFVADFIGSPPMNLFATNQNGCDLKLLSDALPAVEKVQIKGENYFLGIRPEHLTIRPAKTSGTTSAEVEFVEPLGQNTNVFVNCAGQRFVIVTDRTSARIGDTIGVGVEADKIRVVAKDKK